MLGFGEHDRFMWNCRTTGTLKVKSGQAILPEEIQDFIVDEMVVYSKPHFNRLCDHNVAQGGASMNLSKRGISKHSSKLCEEEEEMICPRFIMKIIGKYTN